MSRFALSLLTLTAIIVVCFMAPPTHGQQALGIYQLTIEVNADGSYAAQYTVPFACPPATAPPQQQSVLPPQQQQMFQSPALMQQQAYPAMLQQPQANYTYPEQAGLQDALRRRALQGQLNPSNGQLGSSGAPGFFAQAGPNYYKSQLGPFGVQMNNGLLETKFDPSLTQLRGQLQQQQQMPQQQQHQDHQHQQQMPQMQPPQTLPQSGVMGLDPALIQAAQSQLPPADFNRLAQQYLQQQPQAEPFCPSCPQQGGGTSFQWISNDIPSNEKVYIPATLGRALQAKYGDPTDSTRMFSIPANVTNQLRSSYQTAKQ